MLIYRCKYLYCLLLLAGISQSVFAKPNTECINDTNISFTQESDTDYDLRLFDNNHPVGNRVFLKVTPMNAPDETRIHQYFVPTGQAVNVTSEHTDSVCIIKMLTGFGEASATAPIVEFYVDENRRIFVSTPENKSIVVIARHDWIENNINYFGSMTVQLNNKTGFNKDYFFKHPNSENNKYFAAGVYAQGLAVTD